MQKILQKLLEFREQRDWIQFHTPQNLAKSIVLEAAELLEVFQWKRNDQLELKDRRLIAEEMADIFNWLILLSHDLNIDLKAEAMKKIEKNATKYPIAKSKSNAKKYTDL
ncbi:MAG: nucleotide pyrophosphohydrolase [Microgenomates group bacterium]